jgi:hypothetical protein
VDNSFSIVWIAVLLVTVLTVLVIALRYGIDRSSDKAGARRIALDIGRLRASFRAATGKIEANIVSHDNRYDIPWVVLLHDGNSSARPAIEACGLSQALLSEILIETLSKTGLNDLLPVNIGLQQVDVNALTSQYNQIVLQLQKISQTLGDNDPLIVQLKNSQKDLKISLKSSLSTYRKMMQTRINEIEKISQNQTQQYAALPFQEKAIRSIDRQQEIKETLYIILLQKREEAAVNLAIINPSIKIIDYALAELIPISPKGNIIYLAGLVIGLTIPFLIIYIYLLLDTKIHTKSDIEKVLKNIPFIAEIPHITDDVKMVKYLDRSVLSESFRMLRTNLGFLVKENDNGLVLFSTSTIKGEGKTFVSMNLAITLSTLGKKVILVGADLRNPQLHKMLNIVRNKKGVTNFLHDTAASYKDMIENGSQYDLKFDIIFSGTISIPSVLIPIEFVSFCK